MPVIDLPAIGLYIPANRFNLPSFTVPPSLDFTVPLLGLAKVSTKIHSNFYSWEGSISGGNNTVGVPSYVVQYMSMAESPLSLLSYKLEGKLPPYCGEILLSERERPEFRVKPVQCSVLSVFSLFFKGSG